MSGITCCSCGVKWNLWKTLSTDIVNKVSVKVKVVSFLLLHSFLIIKVPWKVNAKVSLFFIQWKLNFRIDLYGVSWGIMNSCKCPMTTACRATATLIPDYQRPLKGQFQSFIFFNLMNNRNFGIDLYGVSWEMLITYNWPATSNWGVVFIQSPII